MDEIYWLDIPELDAQHEEIEETIISLNQATKSKDSWHLIHYILVRLHELLRIHFTVEESVMRIVGYPDIQQHKQTHKDLIEKVVQFKNQALIGNNCCDIDIPVINHILDHDAQFAEYLKIYSGAIRA